ncbi:MAG: DUF1385 domain-containing protein [Clostridia bacterium]|nr:DUF1385 domain-containing protein [Clostridia bacterium]
MNEKKHITSIGGQAVIEGVMMRGPYKTAVAVRKPDGEIIVDLRENGTKKRNTFCKLPIVRGCVNFFESLVIGMKALMFSAEFMDIEGDEDEPESKFDKWLNDKFGDNIKDIVIYVSLVLSLFLSIGLFILLPTVVTRGLEAVMTGKTLIPIPSKSYIAVFAGTRTFTSLVEGILRMTIFILYLAIVSKMKDIQRVFEYHGAEHKSISCYENGEELTVENVRKHSRFHPRCGTSFLLFVMIVSIILFALLPRTGVLLRMGMRLLLLPIVAGISYEIIKIAGKSTNGCVRALTKPGLWLQRLTTREPYDSQIEVAIESIKSVLPENKEDDRW